MLTDLVRSLAHPSELWAIAAFVYDTKLAPRRDQTFIDKAQTARLKGTIVQDTHEQCYHFLNLTSRSFAAVVQALHPELRDAICLFYLVLRGLDTVEDDMTIARDEVKVPLLRCFHEKLTVQGWQFHGNDAREKDRALLQHFDVVIAECARLKPAYLAVIVDICKRMGGGMADFAAVQKIGTRADWNLYCHYVAGLVGVGLCRMFAASGLEDRRVADVEDLANSMGLFLQKVNIIRDYLEDFVDGRTFWPEEVWSKHGKTLGDLRLAQNEKQARACLNELIADALELIPDCLQFMSMLKEPSVFKFCAIPQVMAIATLAECFDNPAVFRTNVKIRKGLALRLMRNATSMAQVRAIFREFCAVIAQRAVACCGDRLHVSVTLAKVDRWMVEDARKDDETKSSTLGR